jgi:hypothetical protein
MVKRFRGGLISANSYYTSVNNITYGSNTLFVGQQLTPTQSSYNVNRQIKYGNVTSYSFLVNRYDRFPSSIFESETRSFTVKADNARNGTTLYWTIKNITTSDSDFTAVSGSFSVTNGIGTFSVLPIAEPIFDPDETFQIEIRTGSISGPVQVTSDIVTVKNQLFTMNVLAVGAGGGGGGNDATSRSGGGGSGGVVEAILNWTGSNVTVIAGGGGGGGAAGVTGTGGGTAGANGGGRGGNAGTSPNSGAGGGGGGWSGIYSGPTYYLVAGGGAGGGGAQEGTAKDVNASGGGIQPNGVNGTSLSGTQGGDYSGDGGGGGGGGGGYYGGVCYPAPSGAIALAQSGGGNYANPAYVNSANLINGSYGKSQANGSTAGSSVVYNWTGYSSNAGAGGFAPSANQASGSSGGNGKVIIRYLGSKLFTGGTYSTDGTYSYHTFANTSPETFSYP